MKNYKRSNGHTSWVNIRKHPCSSELYPLNFGSLYSEGGIDNINNPKMVTLFRKRKHSAVTYEQIGKAQVELRLDASYLN